VLNGNNSTTTSDPANLNSNRSENINPNTTTSGWVTKTDRHLQLINTSVFEKGSQNRAKAIEESKKQKLKQRDEREKLKFSRYLQRINGNSVLQSIPSRSGDPPGNYEINVNGIQFRVAKSGSKLVKVPGETSHNIGAGERLHTDIENLGSQCPGDLNAAKATPKTAMVGGVKFHRSKNGNMFRSGIIKAQRYERPSHDHGEGAWNPSSADVFYNRRSGVVKKINEPCKAFSTTGNPFLSGSPNCTVPQSRRTLWVLANTLTSFLGSCSKGPRCRYIHDPSKVAVCKEFLLKGSCPSGDSCDLSHDLTPQRTPSCLHFAKGSCSNPICRYTHVRVSPAAPVCRAFGIYGYCEKGSACEERHVHECPDFSNTGICNTKGCKLPHRHKASVMRTNTAVAEDDNSDLSSDDEDEEIDSDDVDSDDLDEEFFGDEDAKPDLDSMQQDFVHFS
jgi:hypothetical protein